MTQSPPPPPPPPGYPPQPPRATTSPGKGLAIASLLCGIGGLLTCGVSSLVGVILGIVALAKMSQASATQGKGLAIAGLVVSAIGILVIPLLAILAAILIPSVSVARGEAYRMEFTANLRQLSVAGMAHTAEKDGRLPSADAWPAELGEYVGGSIDEMTAAPSDREAGRAVAMNAAIAGRGIAEVQNPSRTVLFYECAPGSPPAGGPDLLPPQPRYRAEYVVAFVDGHVEAVPPERVFDLVWEP